MPVYNDSIIYSINNMKPQKEQNYLHISSIIPGKESNKRTSSKVENKTMNKQTRISMCQEEKKENRKQIPHNCKCLMYFALNIALQATT